MQKWGLSEVLNMMNDADRYKQQMSHNKNKRNGGSFNLLQNNKPIF